MGKFTEELEKWVQERDKRQQKRRQDALSVEFLAIKKNVTEAIEAGYSLKTTWEYLKEDGKIQSTYETFRRHVQRFIKSKPNHQATLAYKNGIHAPTAKQQTGSKPEVTPQSERKGKPSPPGTSGFKFDAKPNKEDLI